MDMSTRCKYIVKSYDRKDVPVNTKEMPSDHHIVYADSMKNAVEIFSEIHPECIVYDVEEISDAVVYGV